MTAPDSSFRLDRHLDDLYRTSSRTLRCPVTDGLPAFQAWQETARAQARALLGLAGRPEPRVRHQDLVQSRDRGAYTEEKWSVTADEDVAIPVYFLVPHAPGPHRPLLVFHGHNPSVQYILGHYPDAETARRQRALDDNYAQRLAEAGYLVCAVEQRGFGERLSRHDRDKTHPNSCRHQSFFYQMMGRTMVGERCRDGMAALSVLRQRPDVMPDRVGVTGCSGGGTTALWLGAIDEQLDVVVPGNYFCSFRDSIMAMRHCECNYVPGTTRFFEMGDIAALMVPRPLLFIQGEFDDIFPIQAARREFGTVKAAYALAGVPERLAMTVKPTGPGGACAGGGAQV